MGDNCYTPEQLAQVDWSKAKQADNHPVRVRVTSNTVYDLETDAVIAMAYPPYRFAWLHGHVHMVPADWQVVKSVLDDEVKTQIAKPLL